MAPRKIIIDTDPGVDDILAMLLAFSAKPEELEVLLLSVTYGNIDVCSCLHNVVSLFHQIEKELAWRKASNRPLGFETLRATKPLVAVGPEHPLADDMLMADYFHGRDGLGGIHESHPHLSPTETWNTILDSPNSTKEYLFTPSKAPAHKAILDLLRSNEPDTITIVAIGPLTNLALAAAEDPETLLRAHEVVIMGGNISTPGNITPVAEFNTFADPMAAARVYALTSPRPNTTMPPDVPPIQTSNAPTHLGKYPDSLPSRLKITLFPLDITNTHLLTRSAYTDAIASHPSSPLAEWTNAFLTSTFTKVASLLTDVTPETAALQMHDPMCIWYCLSSRARAEWGWVRDEDLRVETAGQWTRGMCVVDRRGRRKKAPGEGEGGDDCGLWLREEAGNRITRCVSTPGQEVLEREMMRRIFGEV
ncbi:inosine-uridine preferring nucleoside hydrolase [Piedraia hortae CBS 480.64]|uniref:Inosine-uridine preferring nucleoside hydrolase n=1 Tax=Piedraia hortae CBS 480.64 TaxID=1314780 RepID=A0A6A7C6A8_9PEZI|nr:inosine-uridine preferring nucleoside hydrolase [Piedraia hortae CBS 480.64]